MPAPRVISTDESYWAPIVRRMHAEGHQVALHGYAHEHFDELGSNAERLEVLERSAAFFARPEYLNGLAPTYVRPPWGECDDGGTQGQNGCLAGLTDAGYRVVFWDMDPRDWENDSEFEIHKSFELIQSALSPQHADPAVDSFLFVAHDIHLQTAINLTQAMLQTITERGYRAVTVGECVGEPSRLWYRQMPTEATALKGHELPLVPGVWVGGNMTAWSFAVLAGMAVSALCWALWMYKTLRQTSRERWNGVSTRKA